MVLEDAFDKEVQLRLIKKRGLDAYLDNDLDMFYQKFSRLKELATANANNENFEEAYGLFCHIFDAIPIMIHNLSDMTIVRAARNKLGEIFSTQERISYNKQTQHIGPGKFNVWYQPMFYGCLPYIPENDAIYPEPRLVAALECCKELHREGCNLLVQDITIGAWKIVKPFLVVNFAFDHVHLANNPDLKAATQTFLNDISRVFSKRAVGFIKEVYEYFSCLCRTGSDNSSYFVLTALFSAIKEYYGQKLDTEILALLSSSAASEGHGLNIVMTPDAVDKHLVLKRVMMERYHLTPGTTNYLALPITEIVVNDSEVLDFHYHFKNYKPLPQNILQHFVNSDFGYLSE